MGIDTLMTSPTGEAVISGVVPDNQKPSQSVYAAVDGVARTTRASSIDAGGVAILLGAAGILMAVFGIMTLRSSGHSGEVRSAMVNIVAGITIVLAATYLSTF